MSTSLTDLRKKIEDIVRTDVITMTENTTVGNQMITENTSIAWSKYGTPASKKKRK